MKLADHITDDILARMLHELKLDVERIVPRPQLVQ